MSLHILIVDIPENGQVERVWQKQVVYFVHDPVQHLLGKVFPAVECQVDVGAVPVVPFGAGAV